MESLHFKTNVQIKSIIGKDLINDDNIAILELVKNSFDADAKRVDISFCNLKKNDDDNKGFTDQTSRLIIRDNGIGMDLEDINEKWLNIAYSEKKNNSRQHNRMMAGAKGVGRFSCDRLGCFLNLYARKKDKECILLQIDWKEFEIDDKQKEIQSIDLKYEVLDEDQLKQRGILSFEHGVILEIVKLRSNWVRLEGEKWITDKLAELKRYLEKLINPNQAFEKNDFGIYLSADEFAAENQEKSFNEKFIGKVENTIFQKLDFKTTSIECKSIEEGKQILTTLKDKGETIFWIKELSDFYPEIQNFKITLYYLNTYAKAFFTKQTGMRSVSYGSVFLFLNGFRIPPYGEEGDDWLKLEQRRSQGYARYISARDLVGQIEILDTNDSFQIVSSREGLVKNDNYAKLVETQGGLFYKVLRRLEKYVVDGLNWDSIPEEDKNKVAEIEKKIISGELAEDDLKYQEDAQTKKRRIYESIHSIILANYKKVIELYINEHLIETRILEEKKIAEQEFSKLLEDFENKKISGDLLAQILQKKAQESKELEKQLADFSKYTTNELTAKAIAEIQAYKNTIEEQARTIEFLQKQLEEKDKEIILSKTDAEKRIQEAERKAEEEERKRKEAEKERDAQAQKAMYISATRHTTQEVQDITHAISVSSGSLISIISTFARETETNSLSTAQQLEKIHEIGFFANRIKQLSLLITKADIVALKTKSKVELSKYICEYMANFSNSASIKIDNKCKDGIIKLLSLLDIGIVFDNLISNAIKAQAGNILLTLINENQRVVVDFSDDGIGVDLDEFTSKSIFEEGVTNRRGGSGIGLHTIKYTMEERLNGSVTFVGNGLHKLRGATFRLVFN